MRVATSNAFYLNNKLPAYRARLVKTGVAVMALQEAQHVGNIKGYTRYSAEQKRAGVAQGTALYVRDNVRVDGHVWQRGTEGLGGNAHARYLNMVYVRHGGVKWAPIVIHNNPGRLGKPNNQAANLMRSVLEFAEFAKAEGYHPFVLGDFNRRSVERGVSTPFWLSKQLGGKMLLHGIDGIVVPKGVEIAAFNSRGRPPGADHQLITAKVKKV